ncbi:MAG: hypothetical protein HYY04_16105 [Chloroflexi bacterium]|nr:hypothetical protein [Chloroflexota bacterium]
MFFAGQSFAGLARPTGGLLVVVGDAEVPDSGREQQRWLLVALLLALALPLAPLIARPAGATMMAETGTESSAATAPAGGRDGHAPEGTALTGGDAPEKAASGPGSREALTTRVPGERIGRGISVADLSRLDYVRELGLTYVKLWVSWASSEPVRGIYSWQVAPRANDVDNIANAVARHPELKLVLRVDTPPAWAAPGSGNRPPSNPADFGDFMGALARYLGGRVAAYEIWNEPNLGAEWGGQRPDPAGYAALLCDAYAKIKAQDPRVAVVSAGLASTRGDGGVTAMDDLTYLREMYAAGARGCFDALGSHPYGFDSPPESRHPSRTTDFQRAADQRQAMVENGDADKPVWATELGWLLDPGAYGHAEYLSDPLWAGRPWQVVEPRTQADYLVRAYRYADQHWPWMRVMLVFNLDFSTVYWYPPAEHMRFFAILNDDGSPRPAFKALRSLASPGPDPAATPPGSAPTTPATPLSTTAPTATPTAAGLATSATIRPSALAPSISSTSPVPVPVSVPTSTQSIASTSTPAIASIAALTTASTIPSTTSISAICQQPCDGSAAVTSGGPRSVVFVPAIGDGREQPQQATPARLSARTAAPTPTSLPNGGMGRRGNEAIPPAARWTHWTIPSTRQY